MKSTIVHSPSPHHPPLFQELLNHCEDRVARVSQIKCWVDKNREHFEWYETTWSLSEHEEGSEEYAFVKIFRALEDIIKKYNMQEEIKLKLDECPADKDSREFRSWARKHERYYDIYLSFFQKDFQRYPTDSYMERRHLTIPISCYQCTELYADKEDFKILLEFAEYIERYLRSDLYVPALQRWEQLDIDESLWDDEDFLREFAANKVEKPWWEAWDDEDDYEEEEEEKKEFDLLDIMLGRNYTINDSIEEAKSFHETMIEPYQLKEWAKKSDNVFYSIIDDHWPYCGCAICSPFLDIYYPMNQLSRLMGRSEEFQKLTDEYAIIAKDSQSLATFYLKHSSLLNASYLPSGLTRIKPGFYCYDHQSHYCNKIRFLYQTNEMENLFDNLEFYTSTLEAIENHLLEQYNQDNKTYFTEFYDYQVKKYYNERYEEVAAGYFDTPAGSVFKS